MTEKDPHQMTFSRTIGGQIKHYFSAGKYLIRNPEEVVFENLITVKDVSKVQDFIDTFCTFCFGDEDILSELSGRKIFSNTLFIYIIMEISHQNPGIDLTRSLGNARNLIDMQSQTI